MYKKREINMDRYKVAAILNGIAGVGATLQATGVLNMLGPTGMAITAALLAAINTYLHAAPDATVAAGK